MDYLDFEKKLSELEEKGLKRRLRSTELEGKINLSSNDYLGLSKRPEVQAAAQEATRQFGTGGTSSRLLAGSMDCHQALETEIAAAINKEKALVYSSGYHVNTGVLPVLAGPEDVIFFDRLCHASIVDGIRLSKARFYSFDHNSADHLESRLRTKRGKYKNAFVVTEGLFSMDGDPGILQEVIYLAEKWKAYVYLDEAHSFGVVGPEGKGLAAAQGLLPKVDFWVGTLSKTLGSQGGVVAGPKSAIDLLISASRSFIYTTSLAPAAVGAARSALGLLPSLEPERAALLKKSEDLRRLIKNAGFGGSLGARQIIPVRTGTAENAKFLSEYLFRAGFYVPSIRPPTVAANECRVRLSITTDVSDADLARLGQGFTAYADQKLEDKPIGAFK